MLIRDPLLITKIASWREKCANGTITLSELREAVLEIRQGRVTSTEAARRAPTSRRKAPGKSGAELLDEIENL